MEPFEIPGSVAGTALRFEPAGDGRPVMTAWVDGYTAGYNSVVLRPEWLRPLAAWFAGEAEPGIVGHDEYGMPYGRWLTMAGDETAVVTNTHTEARLECLSPYGHAWVTIGPRNWHVQAAVGLSPGARAEAAAFLRRISAESWTAPSL